MSGLSLRRLDGAHLLPLVRAGIRFVDGVHQADKGSRTRRPGNQGGMFN